MSELSPDVGQIARKSLTLLLRRVERVGQNTLARACDVDDSTISGDKTRWERFCKEAAVAGVKLVPVEVRCYSTKAIEPLLELARQRMAQLHSVDDVQFDEDPE